MQSRSEVINLYYWNPPQSLAPENIRPKNRLPNSSPFDEVLQKSQNIDMYKKISTGLITLSFLLGAYAYTILPEKIVSHWNIYGNPDGYMSKFWGAFLMPIIGLVVYLFLRFMYKIDPLKENLQKFHKKFEQFITVFIGFLLYLYLLTILWNTGIEFDIISALLPGFSIFFYFVGDLVQHSKRNWMVGIRTSWSMQSDEIWEKTNKLAGKMFRWSAVIILIGIFFQPIAFYLTIISIFASAIYPAIYSYQLYKKSK